MVTTTGKDGTELIAITSCHTVAELKSELEALHEGSDAVLVKGFAVGNERYHGQIMEAVAAFLGPPRCYPASRYGSGPVHVLAEPAPPRVADDLDWHTEDSYALTPPAFVALLCIKGDAQVRTHLCHLNGPAPEAASEGMTCPDPYLYGDRQPAKRPLAFAGRRGPGWRYDPALITPCTSDPALCPSVEPGQHGFVILEDGDLLVFDNHVLTHSRDGHSAKDSRRVLRMIND